MLVILIERYRIGNLDRHLPNVYFHSQLTKRSHRFIVESCNGFWLEGDTPGRAIATVDHEVVFDEIKLHFEKRVAVRHRGCSQSASRHIERDVPIVIDE